MATKRPASTTVEPTYKKRNKTSLQSPGRQWSMANGNSPTNNLLHTTGQYPILEHIVAHLRPADLIPLAQTCQTMYANLNFGSRNSHKNLLTKILCSGLGLYLRNHISPPHPGGALRRYGTCGGEDTDLEMEKHPCVRCGVNTCDECRVHMIYQSLVEDAGPGNIRLWAGHVQFSDSFVRLFPPKHMNLARNRPWFAELDEYKPQHDVGRVGVVLDSEFAARPESLDHILDTNLGRRISIEPKGPIGGVLEGRAIMVHFNIIVKMRILYRCDECFVKDGGLQKRCQCTLRERFVQRWTCVRCGIHESHEDYTNKMVTDKRRICPCAKDLEESELPETWRMMCNWCKGKIIEGEDDEEDEQVETKDEDDQADGSGDPYDALGATQVWVLSEDLSRSMLLEWEERGIDDDASPEGTNEN
ncbi:hypothetical protein EK21DRAFT_112728 [Setomelanomma holmii]|uniref:F-box domain-containing protein n=1 Tax=Setomelanomma holmii TaxID=210430 RepID=A0A9P4LLY4_9PLEO|nr:hypothetical protein EK21DRAFT_112728 [Setomelanomma holmii]